MMLFEGRRAGAAIRFRRLLIGRLPHKKVESFDLEDSQRWNRRTFILRFIEATMQHR